MSVNVWGATETIDIIATIGASSNVTLNGTSTKVNDYISINGAKNDATNPPVINAGTDLRFYKYASGKTPSTVTISATKNATITKIEFLKDATTKSTLNSISASPGALSENVWTGSASDVTLTYANTSSTFSKQIYIINVTYSYEGEAKTLSSIAISGTPTKTTYETGESFDVSDLTVTGTYSDESTDDLTDDAEWTIDPATFTSTSQTSVSVTATVGEKSDTKQYNVTVTEHVVTPGTYEIVPNNTFFGVEVQTSGKHDPVTGKQNDITITHSGGSSFYCNASQVRTYANNTLTFSVPAGYEITSIVLAVTDNASYNADNGTYTASSKTWAGHAQQVVLTSAQTSGNYQITKITVTYVVAKTLSDIAVKNAPTKTTYYVGDDFDPAGLVITASYTDESAEDIAYTEDNKDAFSFSGFNSEAEATDQVITVTYAEKSATFNVDIQAARTLNSIEVATNPTKMVYEVGEALDLTGLVVNGIYSTGDPEAVEYTASPANGAILDAVGNTTVTLTSVDNTELTTSFNVTVNAIEGDRLTLASTGVSSGYTAWTDKTGSEGVAKYAGQSSNGNSSIQMRNQSPSGIVSTTSGGLIKKVKVDWNTNTANGRSIKIYGSNTAYTESADVYDSEKRGEELGSIAKGTTELEITGDFAYVGILPVGGAMYLNSITFVWAAPKELVSIAVKTAPTVVNYAAGEFFNPAGLVITATYDDESAADIAYEGNEDKFSFSPALDAALATTDEKVAITYGGKSCDQTITVKNIELTSIVVSGDLSKTEYTEGDDFDFTGLVATGYYSDESHKTITDQVDWSIDPATLSAGQTSVKVIATMNEISDDETYGITVNEAPKYATFSGTAGSDVVFTTGSSSADGAVWAGSPCAKGIITLTGAVTSGSNYSYYDGSVVRFYTNNNLVLTPANGYKITKIEIVRQSTTGNNGGTINCVGLTADENNTTTNTNIFTGSTKGAVTFTASAQARFTSISVHYATAAPSAATPTITPSVEAETYFDNITVTLASEGADAIYYTTNGDAPTTASALYENPIAVSATTTIKAIAVKDGLDNSEIATKTFNFGPVYANLVDLVNADLTSGTTVKVSFENVEIKSIFVTQQGYRNGIYFDIQKGGKDIEIFYNNVPESWVAKGTVSGTMTCPWKNFQGTWELAPDANSWNWSNLTYNAPAVTGLTKVEVEGAPSKTTYVDGEKFNPAGLTIYATIDDVRDVYDGSKGEVIYTVDPETLTEGTTSVSVIATIGTVSSDPYIVNGLTVTAIQESTIANFIENEGGRCYLIGTVSGKSGNNFTLTDASGSIYVYGHTLAAGVEAVANDDYIKVIADEYKWYEPKTGDPYHEALNVVVVEKLEKPHVAVTGISLNKTATTITIGKTETLVATIEPADASDKEVIWTSSDENVATVEGGVVTAVAAGDAVITAKSHENEEITATCNVTVVAAQVKYFALATSTADLDAAVTNGKKVVIAPATSETATVVMGTYSTGNNIAEMEATYADERLALEVGEDAFYTIAKDGDYYTFQDGNGKYIYAAGGTGKNNYLKAKEELEANGKWTVTIDASTKNATIKTSDSEVARHTIYYNDGNNFFSCYATAQKAIALYVEAEKPAYIPVESIVLNETSAEVMVGKKLTLTATVGPEDATQKGVTWTSNNDKVTVEDGVVTVDAEAEVGTTATITATTVGTTTEGGSEHLSATCVITVIAPVVNNYYLVTDASTLHAGDIIVLAATKDGKSYINGDLSGDHLTSVDATITDDVLSTADAFEFVLGGEEGAWTLTSTTGILGATGAKKLTYVGTQTGFVGTWTISIDEDNNATIAPDAEDYGKFLYNVGSPRFLTYTSAASATMLLPQLYRKYETIRTDMTDGQIGTGCQTKNILDVKGATLYQVNYTYGSYLVFMEVTYPVEAGMPIIMQADGTNGGKVEVLYGENEVTEAIYNDDGLHGYIGSVKFDIPEGYPYYVFKGGMLRPSQGNYTTSGHAYIKLDEVPTTDQTEGSPAPRRRLSVGIERSMPTGFETIMMQKGMNKVIMNNQLYLIRDGKLFNAQGALVK